MIVVRLSFGFARQGRFEELRLGSGQVLQRASRTLGLAGAHRLLAHVHEDMGWVM
jgi:hypothetical protein